MKTSHHLTVRGKLLSLNFERKMHHMTRAQAVKLWRTDTYWQAKVARIPKLERVSIIGSPFQCAGVLADAMNYAPSLKAAIDGLVDAGVLDDDDGEHVTAITMLAPRRTESNIDHLTVELIEVAQ